MGDRRCFRWIAASRFPGNAFSFLMQSQTVKLHLQSSRTRYRSASHPPDSRWSSHVVSSHHPLNVCCLSATRETPSSSNYLDSWSQSISGLSFNDQKPSDPQIKCHGRTFFHVHRTTLCTSTDTSAKECEAGFRVCVHFTNFSCMLADPFFRRRRHSRYRAW